MEHWQGAQWVLVTLWVVMILMPIAFRVVELNSDKTTEWRGKYIARLITIAFMALILAWGGFWT